MIDKQNRRFLWLFLLIFSILPVSANQKLDSLTSLINESKNQKEVLDALKSMSSIFRDKPEEVRYLKQLLEKATEMDTIPLIYDALSNLSRHYYNLEKLDSLIYWGNYADSLSEVRKENPDVYYDIHGFISKTHLQKGYIEISIDEAVKMQNKAKETNQIYGQICSSETLGLIYQNSARDSLAINAFQEALDLLDSINGDLYYRIYIQSKQIGSLLNLKDQSQTEKKIQRYEFYITRWENKNRQRLLTQQASLHRWMLYSFYAIYYLQNGQLKKGKEYMDESIAYGNSPGLKRNITVADFYSAHAQILYYNMIKNFAQSLVIVDSLLTHVALPEFILLKIDILSNIGKEEEAGQLYKELLQSTEEQNSKAFVRQVEQLRTLQDVNDKNLQAKELQISQTKVRQNQRLLVFSIVLLVALAILIYIISMLLKRFRRFQKILIKEKECILESQENLIKAKQKAETASKMKSTFIANISHEIRTPLNAIVGFTSLVVDPACDEEERKEYSSIINDNSDLLLNIINDVLDLSKMETGNLNFKIRPCELRSYCKETLSSFSQRVAPNVKLKLDFPYESFTLDTDPLRLKQLLFNLLSNAIKFTEEGEIKLAVEIEEDKQQIRFSVTDTGCGIPPEKREKIFERFEKINDYVQGAGLGLPICRMIAERLGGSIFVDPSYTAGTRFVFIHPFTISH